MAELPLLEVRDRQRWRSWPSKNHASSPGVWLVYFKEHTGTKSIPYHDSVCEALCFIRRLDDDRYARKFTPRKPASKWSESNRVRWAELKDAGLMSAAGAGRGSHGEYVWAEAGNPGAASLYRESAKDQSESTEVFSRARDHGAAPVRGLDSCREEARDARETNSGIDRAAAGREKARVEVGGASRSF